MTQYSAPWNGIAVGDAAVLAPYSATEWDDLFEALWASGSTPYEDFGVCPGYLNELEVTGVASPVAVDTGGALVKGKVYRNTASVPIGVPLPAGATRTDYIVLRSSWTGGTNQTIRAVLLQNPVEGSGTPPVLTQTDGTTWEIPLAVLDITVGGVITVSDYRKFLGCRPTHKYFTAHQFSCAFWATNPGDDLIVFPNGLVRTANAFWRIPEHRRINLPEITLHWFGSVTAGGNVTWQVVLSIHECDAVVAYPALSYYMWQDSVAPVTADVLRCTVCTPSSGLLNGGAATITEFMNYAPGRLVRVTVVRAGTAPTDTYVSNAEFMGLNIEMA